ncbi:hypothetical protein CALVIDRAFT_601972 [Calocera viscosa TUFC12733]|uniref:Uncharacterized protein n=1 Tax=Calocera viscosa (strain TUFC12733) TaxID=1330018 RepID=A0A167HLJ0_CALVF|nr:hypothetical protein CALVIDRAFT_601972 [Calocera viscosa TUFC12733]
MAALLTALRNSGLLRPRRLSGPSVPPPVPPKPAGRTRAFTFTPVSASSSASVSSTPAPDPHVLPKLAQHQRAHTVLPARPGMQRQPSGPLLRLRKLTVRRKPKVSPPVPAKDQPQRTGLKREKTVKRLRGMGVYVVTTVEQIYEQALIPFSGPSHSRGPSLAFAGSHSRGPSVAFAGSGSHSRGASLAFARNPHSRNGSTTVHAHKRASTLGGLHSRKTSLAGLAGQGKGHGRTMSSSSMMRGEKRASVGIGIGGKRFSNMVNRRASQQLMGAMNLLEMADRPPAAPAPAPAAEPAPAGVPSPAPVPLAEGLTALSSTSPAHVESQPAPPSSFSFPSGSFTFPSASSTESPDSRSRMSTALSLGGEESSLLLSEAGRRRLLRLETRSASRLALARG